jgi:histidine phosphotransfer protein HptB
MDDVAQPIDGDVFAELQDSAGADFVVELVDAFADEAPGLLAAMRTALAGGDVATFRRAAHSLKSNGQTFGAGEFAALAREMERGEEASRSAAALDRLEALLAQAIKALRELCQ